MARPLTPDALIVSANGGRVLIDGPGVAVTLDLDAASVLLDELIAASAVARRQLHAAIDDEGAAPLASRS